MEWVKNAGGGDQPRYTLPVYDASAGGFTRGQTLIWGQDATGTAVRNALVDSAAVPIDIFAVINEDPAANNTNVSTPLIVKADVTLVLTGTIWKCYWDGAAANDIDVSSSTSTVLTHASGDDNLDGSWVYINSGTGVGQLRFCSAAAATTKTVSTAFTTTPDSTSDFLLIRHPGLPTGGQNLDTTFSLLLSALSATGQILILKNFIEYAGRPVEELDPAKHAALDGLNNLGVRFFSHIMFMDTYFAVDSI